MPSIKLYDYELSGNCYKVRLLLHLLDVAYEAAPVDFFPGREHKAAWFRESVNPLGQLPVIDDGGYLLRDAQAILVYLASRYDPSGRWYPDEARIRGNVTLWLLTADDLTRTASAARLHDMLGYELDVERARAGAHELLRMMDDYLADAEIAGQHWLAAAHATVADIACFPYTALAPQGGIALDDYPAVRRWIDRVRHLPRFTGMPGIFSPQL